MASSITWLHTKCPAGSHTLSEVYVYVQGLQFKERTVGRESIAFEMGFKKARFYS